MLSQHGLLGAGLFCVRIKEKRNSFILCCTGKNFYIVAQQNSDLGGYQFDIIDGVPSYKAGADAAWVPFKRKPIIEKAAFSWAYSPSQTFPAKEGYEIVGLYADITGINSQNAVNINFGISKNLAAGRISITGQTYVNIMGAFYCIYA